MVVDASRNCIRAKPGTVLAIIAGLVLLLVFNSGTTRPGAGTSSTAWLLERSETIYQRHVEARTIYTLKYGALAE